MILQAELRETHTDYREELTKLARQMSETKQKDATENESFAIKVFEKFVLFTSRKYCFIALSSDRILFVSS